MKKRKSSLLQRMMEVLLSAVLVAGMVSNAAAMTVLAQFPEGGGKNAGECQRERGCGRRYKAGGRNGDGAALGNGVCGNKAAGE